MRNGRLFITGTDTDIGKTVLSFLIMQYYYKKGYTPFYIKPVQTGCTSPDNDNSDADFIYRNIEQLRDKNRGDSVIYCFKNPKAPFFAARNENTTINVSDIVSAVEQKAHSYDPIIIEGAGGLMVPVDQETLMVDIIPKLNARTVLAASAGLGTINHTLLSIEALKNRGIDNPAVVLIKHQSNLVSESMLLENIEAIEAFSGLSPAGVINYTSDFSSINNDTSSVIDKIVS